MLRRRTLIEFCLYLHHNTWSQRWVRGCTWLYSHEDCPSGLRLHTNTHSHSSTKESVLALALFHTPTPSSTLPDAHNTWKNNQMPKWKVPLFLSSCFPPRLWPVRWLFVTVGFLIKKPSGGPPPPQSLSPPFQPHFTIFCFFILTFCLCV